VKAVIARRPRVDEILLHGAHLAMDQAGTAAN
jgi:hypothetical protein